MTLDIDPVLDPSEQMRERRILAAFLLDTLGGTVSNVAEALEVNPETIRRWTKRTDWTETCETARKRWVTGVRQKSRARIWDRLTTHDVKGNKKPDDEKADKLAFDIAERLEPEMAPREKEKGGEGRVVVIIGSAPAGVVRAESVPATGTALVGVPIEPAAEPDADYEYVQDGD